MTAVLDTDFLVAILRGDSAAENKMLLLDQQGPQATAAMVAHELLVGAYRSAKPKANRKKVERLLSSLAILPFNEQAAQYSAQIDTKLAKKGKILPLGDIVIAASALAHGLTTIVTRNEKHYNRINEINVEKW